MDEANAAFDKSIAADPNKAEAYYQKGVNLINKATTDPKTGKVIPAPGTAEALNKYLELQPTGQFADGAKSMLPVHRKQHRDQLRQVKERRANKEVAGRVVDQIEGSPQGLPFFNAGAEPGALAPTCRALTLPRSMYVSFFVECRHCFRYI